MSDDRSTAHDGSPARKGEAPAVDERDALLAKAATDAGDRWAAACRTDLEREGRPVEGGWPGTLAEARAHAAAHVAPALRARAMTAVTFDELGRATRITYDAARRAWQRAPTRKPRRRARAATH